MRNQPKQRQEPFGAWRLPEWFINAICWDATGDPPEGPSPLEYTFALSQITYVDPDKPSWKERAIRAECEANEMREHHRRMNEYERAVAQFNRIIEAKKSHVTIAKSVDVKFDPCAASD